jgi:hypothetical protein
MEFILTIDTEGDNQWNHGRNLSCDNIKYVPRFQKMCERYSIKPTYLVTTEVCEDSFARDLFSSYIQQNKAEIGAHLHSWTTPPFLDRNGFRMNDRNHAFAHELPEQLLHEKIEVLTRQIEAAFGKRPQSFRSGRYGFDHKVAKTLSDHSYLVDSSVTPFINWSKQKGLPDGPGGPDFIGNDPLPHRYTFGSNTLLEIPLTILPTIFPFNRSVKISRFYFRYLKNNKLFKALHNKIIGHQPLWLRPNVWMNSELFHSIVREAEKIQLPYLVMMFHSSELMPGCSIYWKDEAAVGRLYEILESFFIIMNDKKIRSVTLTEAAIRYSRNMANSNFTF